MKTLKFHGASDDLFCEESTGIEACILSNGSASCHIIDDDGQGIVVTGSYGSAGMAGWGIEVVPMDNEFGEPYMPDWVIEMGVCPHDKHSPELMVEAPDSARLIWEIEG